MSLSDPYVSLSFRQIHVVVYGTTSNYLTFRINFIIFLRTPCMNRARTKLLITLGKIVISIYQSRHGAEPNFTSYKFKRKLPCSRRTHTRLVRHAAQGGMRVVLHFHLQVGPQLSKPTIGKPAHRAMAEKTGGRRDGYSTDSKKIGVGWDLCGWRVPYC